jgi:aminoglycoside phosphotransferase (APT) family kinase protein
VCSVALRHRRCHRRQMTWRGRARIQRALWEAGLQVPRVLELCEDADVLGVPFYLMDYIDGVVFSGAETEGLDDPADRRGVDLAMIETLARVHALEWQRTELAKIGKPVGYLSRQLRRWKGLREIDATRDVPAFWSVAEGLAWTMPESRGTRSSTATIGWAT